MEHTQWSIQHSIFLAVQICVAGAICWFWFWLPAPGWAVAILAGVAAAMSVHGKMRPWQKVFWMILIGVLLVIELRAISKDRADSDAKALADRKAQDDAFKIIQDAQKADFDNTTAGLDAAISGIQSTLGLTNQTLKQTQPYASVEFMSMVPYAPSFPIAAGKSLMFNLNFTNRGNAVARKFRRRAKIYIGKLDDRRDQEKFGAGFDRLWANSIPAIGHDVMPNAPEFFSFDSDTFTSDEVIELERSSPPKITLYLLLRFTWTDQTGNWVSDYCIAMQDPLHDLDAGHLCVVHNNHRYRAR
jgi:hypothetical protein